MATVGLAAGAGAPAADPPQQCADGLDNDGDGKIDYPADPGCVSVLDNDETDPPRQQCADGVDNDLDGKIDYPADPGCVSVLDNDEIDPPAQQCADGLDNDRDGKIDYPGDPGCVSALDNDETDLPAGRLPQCSDGKDNDGDGRIDYGQEFGCESPSDDDEVDPPLQTPSSTKKAVLLSPFPVVRLVGLILSNGVRVRVLTVQAPSGSRITIGCRGPARSCPSSTTSRVSSGARLRFHKFERRMRAQTVLRIFVTKAGRVGKYTRFEIVGNRAPRRTDKCARSDTTLVACP